MMHNHVPELIDIFKRYETKMWGFVKQASGLVSGVDPIRYVGDRPTTSYLDELKDYSKGLRAILSVADYGIMSIQRAWFGTYKVDATTRIGVTLITADPTLREEMGSRLFDFLLTNPGLVHGTATNWVLWNTQSGGFAVVPDGLFARIYYLWLREVT